VANLPIIDTYIFGVLSAVAETLDVFFPSSENSKLYGMIIEH